MRPEKAGLCPAFFVAPARSADRIVVETETPGMGAEPRVFTVSQLNRLARGALESTLGTVWVEGEISNLARPSSGHLYFSVKDDKAQVRCAFFRGAQWGLRGALSDGMQVLLRARATLYEPRGDYQLVVEHLEPAGEGELRRRFEALKAKLAAEGLFDVERKRPLPPLPRRIGVITSPSGAVVHDILTTLKRRFPAIAVLLYPVPVQGEGAAEKIAATIALASARRDCDVLILARGGGSLEDLWSFNEESVVRAIRSCALPLVCGVGHETDVTLADLAADARAPTPTAAAEMLSPDRAVWQAQFSGHQRRLLRATRHYLDQNRQTVDWLSHRLVGPQDRLDRIGERLDALGHRMRLAQRGALRAARSRLDVLTARLLRSAPPARIVLIGHELAYRYTRLQDSTQRRLQREGQKLAQLATMLQALSPLATLHRGYAIVQQADTGAVIRTASEVARGDRVLTRLARGSLECVVEKVDAGSD
jgi:exodeoxyribonuclease VII large subunit